MARVLTSSMACTLALMLLALSPGLDAATAETSPAAPTLRDAHHFFQTLVAGNDVTALYETRSREGYILGFQSFPVAGYRGSSCESGLTLKSGVSIAIDWTIGEKSHFGDGTLSVLQGNEVQFRFIHMLSVEGGITVEPSTTIARLIFGISDGLSRDRLVKAIDLMAAACRSRSKFD